MRVTQLILLPCILGLSLLAEAQDGEELDDSDGDGGPLTTTTPRRGPPGPPGPFSPPSPPQQTRSVLVSVSTTTVTASPSFTTPAVINSGLTPSTSAFSLPSNTAWTETTPSPSSVLREVTSNSSSLSNYQRQLVIILSSVLGSIGLLLAVLVCFLVSRQRKRRALKRGVSPIDDEEIESWRNAERKQSTISADGGIKPNANENGSGTIGLAWSTAPPYIPAPPPARINRSASFLARAPNARAGLTDEIVPGDVAFIPPVKRQSSRLSKAPPSHIRTKSRGSSTSMKSMRSVTTRSFINDEPGTSGDGLPTWYDSEYKSGSRGFLPTLATSSPGTSIYDGLNEQGGLSPRPKPRSVKGGIGRAIA